MNIIFKSRLDRELKKLARENSVQGKPISILEDTIFKAVFSSDDPDSNEALRLLLSACTKRLVSNVKIIGNELLPPYHGAKSPRLDIHVTFNDGEVADIEMQLSKSHDNLKARSVYYSALLLSGQSKRGKPYKQIKRVYQVFFLNFVMFTQSRKLPRRYFFLEEEEHDKLGDEIEIIFYEMPKLEQAVHEILVGKKDMANLTDEEKWCIYLKYRYEEQAQPLIRTLCREEVGIMHAERALKKVDRDYLKYAKQMAEIKNEYERWVMEDEVREKVVAEVYAEALAKEKNESAKKMKALGLSTEQIQAVTGLSPDTIKSI
jgi:predicted transposase/invertase (TIGR01784 family)